MEKFILITAVCLLFACGKKAETTKPQWEKISSSVYASGVIKSLNQYQVYPLVSGIIQDVYVDDGDLVTKGQLLMRIDNRTQKWSRENAALLASYSSISENKDKLSDAADAIKLAKEKLYNDSLLYTRIQTLVRQDAATSVDLEQRELAYRSSQNAYQNAISRYKDLQKQLKLSAQQSRNNLEITKKTEDDFLIRSDLDGVVYSILKEKGELASPQFPVAIIGSKNQFLLEMQVDEYDIAHIERGQSVFITMDTYKGEVFEGRVLKINPIMNERSKTFTVEANFTKAPPKLFPNTSFEASIVLQSKAKALVIPKRFLLQGDQVLLSDGTKRKVKIGLRDYEYIEILSGISESTEIMMAE